MPLSAAAVSAMDLEGTVLALWEEFLRGYFDGASHLVGAAGAATFPKAQLRFQQGGLDQPLQPEPGGGAGPTVGMSLAWVLPSKKVKRWETIPAGASGVRQEIVYASATWIFFVRAPGSAPGKLAVSNAAGLLHGLLENSGATRPLAQKGIHRLRPDSPQLVSAGRGMALPQADLQYQVRMVTVTGQLRYAVKSQS